MALKLSDFKPGEIKETTPQSKKGGALNFAKGVGVGIGKSFGELGLGIGQIGRGIQRAIAPTDSMLGGGSMFDTQEAERIRNEVLKANAPGEGTGKFIGTAAQFLAPTGLITKGQGILGAAASQLPKAGGLQLGAKALARFLPEAIGTGAVSAVRSGGDLEQAKQEGVLAGGFSVGLGALGGLARATYWPMLDDSVNKALGVQGKKSGGVALQQTAQKTAGLQVLKNRAKDLQVTADDGLKTTFDPQNASYNTTLQAWKQAREKVFKEYTEIASKAGEKTTLDMSAIRQQMENALDAPILSVEKNAVKSLIRDFDEVFNDPTKVDMQTAERFVKSLNENTVQGFFTGTSDAASSKVNAGTSRLIREMMDDAIEETTGAQYQATRSQYAALKSLEDDLVRKFQQDARSIGGGLPEYTGAFASGDIIGSALSLDPAQFAKGATLGTFAVLKRKLSNPERFLRRSFDLIDDAPSDLALRFWGGSKPLTQGEEKVASNLADSAKNPSLGMSIKKTVTPESVAKRADRADMDVLAKVIDDYDNAILDPKTNVTLDSMGLGKATREERISFAKDVFDEQGGTAMREVVKQADALETEAKKYKSAEEFVKGQGASPYKTNKLSRAFTRGLSETTDHIRGGTWYVDGKNSGLSGAKDVTDSIFDFVGHDIVGGGDVVKNVKKQFNNTLKLIDTELSEGSFDFGLRAGTLGVARGDFGKKVLSSEYQKIADELIDLIDKGRSNEVLSKAYTKALKEIGKDESFISRTLNNNNARDIVFDEIISESLSKQGYDSLLLEGKGWLEENHLFDFSAKTKSQLTDIWNKANGK